MIVFSKTSRRTTYSPLFRRNLQRRVRQSSFFSSTASTTSFKIASLSSRLKSISRFSSSLKRVTASSQRFLVSSLLKQCQQFVHYLHRSPSLRGALLGLYRGLSQHDYFRLLPSSTSLVGDIYAQWYSGCSTRKQNYY